MAAPEQRTGTGEHGRRTPRTAEAHGAAAVRGDAPHPRLDLEEKTTA